MLNVVKKLLILLSITSMGLTPIPQRTESVVINSGNLTTISQQEYRKIIYDSYIDDTERDLLFTDYYRESPKKFMASATWYGNDSMTYVELDYYGKVIRQQMWRGWVLVGSGKFGNNEGFSEKLGPFIEKYYPYLNKHDTWLTKQASPLYYYFADGGINMNNRDEYNQPISVKYEELNSRQKRIYDITSVPYYEMEENFIDFNQHELTLEQALESGKYAGIVSTKSPNDFGKRYAIYKVLKDNSKEFYGIVLVGGMAKRADWTGLEVPTNDYFKWDRYPLITRSTFGYHWGFDFPTSLYKWFGGNGGAVIGIYAVEIP